MNDKQTNVFEHLGYVLFSLLFAGCLLNSCSEGSTATTKEEEPEIAGVVIEPEKMSLEEGESGEFAAFLISESGEIIEDEPPGVKWNWYSSDPGVFTVEAGGSVYGQNGGEAHCIVEVEIESGKMMKAAEMKMVPIGRDSAFVVVLK